MPSAREQWWLLADAQVSREVADRGEGVRIIVAEDAAAGESIAVEVVGALVVTEIAHN